MPSKNLHDLHPMLCVKYPDGHYESLGKIEDVRMEPDIDYEINSEFEHIFKPSEMTIQFKWEPTIQTEYLLITGRLPSRNWLRMHGWPLTRRCGYRKRKKNGNTDSM